MQFVKKILLYHPKDRPVRGSGIILKPTTQEVHLDEGMTMVLSKYLNYPTDFQGMVDPDSLMRMTNKKPQDLYDWLDQTGISREKFLELLNAIRLMAIYAFNTGGVIEFCAFDPWYDHY